MQSSNPVFSRSEGFNGRAPRQAQYGYPTYPGAGPTSGYGQQPGYTDPSTWGTGTPGGPAVDQGRMTVDSVVMRTAMTLGLVVLVAAATWWAMPEQYLGMAWMVGAFGGLGVALAVSFMRKVSPALVLAYAGLEGLFVGAVSKTFEAAYDGIVMGAVVGTLIAFVSTLAAYKFFNITVTPKFRKVVTIAMFGFVGLVLLDFVLSFVGLNFGWNDLNGIGFLATCIGLVLGVLMLVLDFDFVERGVAAGLPERESWRAAFGLTVTIIWLYIEMLRLLAALRGE